jgi:hypothetical protein
LQAIDAELPAQYPFAMNGRRCARQYNQPSIRVAPEYTDAELDLDGAARLRYSTSCANGYS